MTETEELEAILDTCNSEGWQLLVNDLEETMSGLNNILALTDDKSLYKAQGRLEALTLVVNYPEAIRNQLDELDADSQ